MDINLEFEPGGAVTTTHLELLCLLPGTCLELLYLQPSADADAPSKGPLGNGKFFLQLIIYRYSYNFLQDSSP
jgi:hypothetical protein